MSEEPRVNYPYKPLGERLKGIREKLRQSLVEVSGAVEIDMDMLAAIEKGKMRPSEDILLLLISYFGAKEDEADQLWELAGYDRSASSGANIKSDVLGGNMMPAIVVMPMDTKISYTDSVHVSSNHHGLTMNFMQNGGPNGQPVSVARLGMSHEHAKSIIETLQRALSATEANARPKFLPAPKPKTDKKS